MTDSLLAKVYGSLYVVPVTRRAIYLGYRCQIFYKSISLPRRVDGRALVGAHGGMVCQSFFLLVGKY